MPLIPIEDFCHDVIAKAQRGYHISDEDLAARAEISLSDLAAVKSGQIRLAAIRRIARHLKLSPDALETLAKKEAYPRAPVFPRGFAMFNTRDEEMTVNNYLVWDPKTREAAIIDTGADPEATALLDFVASESLRVKHILITHTHSDHIAALPRLAAATGAGVWTSEREPLDHPGARTFGENAYFHLGVIAIKALSTWGHSPGQTTFYVQGLSWPLALCGDSLFSASVGGSPTHFAEQIKNTRARIFSLPKDTVIGPGHGPLTTLAHERKYNPFFAPERAPRTLADNDAAPDQAEPANGENPAPARPVPLPRPARAGRAGRPATPKTKPSKSAKPGQDGRPAFHSRRKRTT